VALSLVTGIAPANAAVGPADDRLQTQPTGWWTYANVDAGTVSAKLSANGARLTDLRVNSASPLRFTVTMVRNTGTYSSGWWWYYGQTSADVSARLAGNSARLITAQRYWTGTGWRYAVVMVPNTGANAKAWWWYDGSASLISAQLAAHSARLISLSSYTVGGVRQFVGIMVPNTGTDAYAWWWYYGVSAATVSANLNANHARIIDLDPNSDGTFNVVMYRAPAASWWYYGQTAGQLVSRALQHGARLIDVTPYLAGGVVRYAGVMVNNLSGLSATLRDQYEGKITGGAYGFELRQAGGPVLAALQSDLQFEPASSMKVLYHLHTLRARQAGSVTDSTAVTYRYKNTPDVNSSTEAGICPDAASLTASTNLQTADQRMMWASDNRMTRAITDRFGRSTILSQTGGAVGLTGTVLQHNIGCPTATTHNFTTLTDLSRIYDRAYVTTPLLNATHRPLFRNRMLNDANYGIKRGDLANPNDGLCDISDQEATRLGKSAAVKTAFCNAISWLSKGGSYGYGDGTVSWSGGSLTGLPVKSGGVISPRYYTFGVFLDGMQITSPAQATQVSNLRSQVYRDAIRPQIGHALTTW
jgi:hypothetical protein